MLNVSGFRGDSDFGFRTSDLYSHPVDKPFQNWLTMPPFASVGRLPKWPTGADCKSAGLRLRWFESITYHHPNYRIRETSAAGTIGSQRPRSTRRIGERFCH